MSGETLFFCEDEPLWGILDAETEAALAATAIENLAPVFGAHSLQKTVLPLAAAFAGLVCAFHDSLPYIKLRYFHLYAGMSIGSLSQ